ncbi:MAG: HdeD family acid-resistance protein [Pirellulales bacterium]|nr:HdeD family acid-resistance protein [Pirellulales bacterium]
MNEAREQTAVEIVPLHTEFRHLKSNWWWFLLLGVFLVVCGTVAIVFPLMSNVAVMVVLGVSLMATGIATVVASFWAGKWSGLLVQLLVGILYVMVGFQITDTPVKAGLVMALFLAGFFIIAGAFRVVAALVVRFPHWGWALLNGIVTFLCGVVIYRHFPECALWVVGLLVGLEMLLNGLTWITLSLAIRSIPDKAA